MRAVLDDVDAALRRASGIVGFDTRRTILNARDRQPWRPLDPWGAGLFFLNDNPFWPPPALNAFSKAQLMERYKRRAPAHTLFLASDS